MESSGAHMPRNVNVLSKRIIWSIRIISALLSAISLLLGIAALLGAVIGFTIWIPVLISSSLLLITSLMNLVTEKRQPITVALNSLSLFLSIASLSLGSIFFYDPSFRPIYSVFGQSILGIVSNSIFAPSLLVIIGLFAIIATGISLYRYFVESKNVDRFLPDDTPLILQWLPRKFGRSVPNNEKYPYLQRIVDLAEQEPQREIYLVVHGAGLSPKQLIDLKRALGNFDEEGLSPEQIAKLKEDYKGPKNIKVIDFRDIEISEEEEIIIPTFTGNLKFCDILKNIYTNSDQESDSQEENLVGFGESIDGMRVMTLLARRKITGRGDCIYMDFDIYLNQAIGRIEMTGPVLMKSDGENGLIIVNNSLSNNLPDRFLKTMRNDITQEVQSVINEAPQRALEEGVSKEEILAQKLRGSSASLFQHSLARVAEYYAIAEYTGKSAEEIQRLYYCDQKSFEELDEQADIQAKKKNNNKSSSKEWPYHASEKFMNRRQRSSWKNPIYKKPEQALIYNRGKLLDPQVIESATAVQQGEVLAVA